MTTLGTRAPVDDTPSLFTAVEPRLLSSHALSVPPRDHPWLAQAAEHVGLLGRGGAAFPVATKLRAVRRGARVVANGSESEPASWKDRVLMRRYPDLVVSGVVLVAQALRSPEAVIAVADAPSAEALRGAVQRAGAKVAVRRVDHGFVGGEIGALINGLNGRVAAPSGIKVLPHVRGLREKSTYASNVETFAQLALLSALGTAAYAAVGGGAEPGTSLVTLHGVERSGVLEVSHGTDLRRLVGDSDRPLLIGGYHGTWTTRRELRVDRAWLRDQGIGWGAGVVAVLPDDTCPVGEVARVAAWLAGESAGQCGPCTFGLPAIAEDVALLASSQRVDPSRLSLRLGRVDGRGACHHPTGAVGFVASALTAFAADVRDHLDRRGCGKPVLGVLPLGGERR